MDRARNLDADGRTQTAHSAAWFAVACALALVLVAAYVVRSGSWLDEYWQLWVSSAPAAALPGRLLTDAHPPWFDLFARLILFVTGESIVPSRLINLAAAAAALAFGLKTMRGLDPDLRWRIGLTIIASGGAIGMTGLAASFRSYPWLLVLAGLQASMLAAVALRRPVPRALALAVTGASVALHYVHAGGAIAIALVTFALAWRSDRRLAFAVLAGLCAGCALDLITGLIQLPHWRAVFDVNWIAESGGGGLVGSSVAVASDFLTGSLVASGMLAAGLLVRRSKTAWLVLAPIPVALIAWLVLDAWSPILVPRYLASLTALLATAAAVVWWELALEGIANVAIALLVALQPLATAVVRPPLPGWEAGARAVASAVRTCPRAQVYAVSPWRFRDHPDSATARFERPVIALAYERVGHRFGLSPRFVGSPATLNLTGCPAIVWIEAAHGLDQVPAATILRRAQLSLTGDARVHVERTPNGAVLLISSADRLQPPR